MTEPSEYQLFQEQAMRSIAASLGIPSHVVREAKDSCNWSATATRPIEDVTRAVLEFEKLLGLSTEPLWKLSDVVVAVALEIRRHQAIERLYLRVHRRLPGSLRTARLRKKRITKVIAWYERLLRLARSGGKPICADCLGPIGRDNGPRDGWELEDGRIVCQACAADDLRQLSAAMISGARS